MTARLIPLYGRFFFAQRWRPMVAELLTGRIAGLYPCPSEHAHTHTTTRSRNWSQEASTKNSDNSWASGSSGVDPDGSFYEGLSKQDTAGWRADPYRNVIYGLTWKKSRNEYTRNCSGTAKCTYKVHVWPLHVYYMSISGLLYITPYLDLANKCV